MDGEPLTPAIFPREAAQEMTEVEMEAMESGMMSGRIKAGISIFPEI